jgi:hypothetical protein
MFQGESFGFRVNPYDHSGAFKGASGGIQMTRTSHAALLSVGMLLASGVSALTISFDDLAAGTTLSTQYAAMGVTFSPNAFSGSGSSSSGANWATNTDMTVVSLVTGTLGVDYGALGTPSLVSNNILHNFSNWQSIENGDPSFRIDLTTPASAVSVTFAGVGGMTNAPDTRIFAYAGSTLLGSVAGSLADASVGQLTLSFAAPGITRIAVAPGSFNDWVGVDNIVITAAAVPEPGAWILTLLGLAALTVKRRWPA